MTSPHEPVVDRTSVPHTRPRDPVGLALVGLISAYRAVFAGRPSPCRFEPTCSAYGLEALRVHGTIRGIWLIVRRVVACRPGGRWGWDPVPPPRPGSVCSAPGGLHGHH